MSAVERPTDGPDSEIRAAYAELPELRDCWCPLAYAAHRLVSTIGVATSTVLDVEEHRAAHLAHIASVRAGSHEHVSFDEYRARAVAAADAHRATSHEESR